MSLPPIAQRIATLIGAQTQQVSATMALLAQGDTIPFIARYRKEVTGGLSDTQLRLLDEKLSYLQELEERRMAVIASIEEQGKLTPELKLALENAETKQLLEDLYLPYKQKRRTKSMIAKEAGLEPLADFLLQNLKANPDTEALAYINEEAQKLGFVDAKTVLDGARHIVMDRWAEDATLLEKLREHMKNGFVVATVVEGKEVEGAKYRDWFDFQEPLSSVPSHRALAIFRGQHEGFLTMRLEEASIVQQQNEARLLAQAQDSQDSATKKVATLPHPCEGIIAHHAGFSLQVAKNQAGQANAYAWVAMCIKMAWRVKLSVHIEVSLLGDLRERSEKEAINVFAHNLKDLLLTAPAGARVTMGLDPGIRTGVKVAVVDATGKVCDTATVYPFEPRMDHDGALRTLAHLCIKHKVQLIAIGNGTASRETDQLAAELIKGIPEVAPDLHIKKIMVSEAGASVYSASQLASDELPLLDVSLRGAVSIARRLQDPLAELVKIDPKSIGVGQYQHDVSQTHLAKSLDAVVEDCVNAVGVDVNTASVSILSRISGLNQALAQNIVEFRDQSGVFKSRQALLKVPRFGPKTFEQAAGFLRIRDGVEPLDQSSVHPEAYPLVQKMLADLQLKASEVMGKTEVIKKIRPEKYCDDRFGLPTVQDILQELLKPGRDPRPEFKTAVFHDEVRTLTDLKPGMTLEGVVTNVANFGAFVDIGVHQDGLVHISALSNKFIKDPREVVKTGQVVQVKVLEVDIPRKRVALTMRLSDDVLPHNHNALKPNRPGHTQDGASIHAIRSHHPHGRGAQGQGSQQHAPSQHYKKPETEPETAMSLAFAKLREKSKA